MHIYEPEQGPILGEDDENTENEELVEGLSQSSKRWCQRRHEGLTFFKLQICV